MRITIGMMMMMMMTMMMLMLMLMLLLVVVVTDKNDVVKCHTFKNYSLMLFLSPQKLQGWHQRHSQNHKR